jgi:hypothetical protein
MPKKQIDDYSMLSFKIFSTALILSVLCAMGVNFGIPFVSEATSNLLAQVCLLVGVNAALVTVATYFVILVGKVKRGL